MLFNKLTFFLQPVLCPKHAGLLFAFNQTVFSKFTAAKLLAVRSKQLQIRGKVRPRPESIRDMGATFVSKPFGPNFVLIKIAFSYYVFFIKNNLSSIHFWRYSQRHIQSQLLLSLRLPTQTVLHILFNCATF